MSAPHPDILSGTLDLVVDPASGLRQFELTGQCPTMGTLAPEVLAKLPLMIWVDVAAHPFPHEEFDGCELKKFVVPRSITNAAHKAVGFRGRPDRNDSCVCEHMGHLIE